MSAPVRCSRCGSAHSEMPDGLCPGDLLRLGLRERLPVGTRLGPYEIRGLIGAGGMGEVYRGWDVRLRREIAVKILPESLSSDPDRLARFEKEAQAASALNHPNIVAVYDVGSDEGTPYMVSELLEGETLRERLSSGSLPLREAVDCATQLARGLAAAHARGIVHRDLKPENLFLSKDGHLKILDFGLAVSRPLDAAEREQEAANQDPMARNHLPAVPTAATLTKPGVILGTVGYMSPEQVKGKAADARSDIFAFGTVLYEMVSGLRAFQRDTAAETISAILKEEPPPLSDARPGVAPGLERIVEHCLQKDPDRRFQSASDIVFSLSEPSSPIVSGAAEAAPAGRRRGLVVAIVAAVILAAAGGLLLRQSRRAPEPMRIAVLPFENTGASGDDYFTDGIADAVRGKLTSIPGVAVIARGSSMPYKKSAKTPRQIAQELDVRYLLSATVRWQKGTGQSNRVEVTPELVEVPASGTPTAKWQQPFDAVLTDVFAVQSEIASQVAHSIGAALGAQDEKRLAQTPTANLDAYQAFLKGEGASKAMAVRNSVGLPRALELYEQAVALDPSFAQAWARVSEASSALYYAGEPRPEIAERSRRAADKAIALAPDRPEGYFARGDYEAIVEGEFARALEQYSKGRRLSPGSADLLSAVARVERSLGRWDAALEHVREAARLDPRSVLTLDRLGAVLYFQRRYREAREVYDRALTLAPTILDTIQSKVVTYLGEGNLPGARAVLAAVPKEIEPTALVAYMANGSDLGWVLDGPQRDLLLRLTPSAFDNDRGAWAICLAQEYAARGDPANLRIHAEDARRAFEEELRASPGDAQRRVFLGMALGYLGRKDEAIREGLAGLAVRPISRDAVQGCYLQLQVVRIHIIVGEPERALDYLEPLAAIPSDISAGRLRIDPNFDPLRGNPRFERLARGAL